MDIKKNESIGSDGNSLCLTFILYNEGKTIGDAIKAFHHQGVPIYDYLVIGIDNKTDDNTLEEVKKLCPESNIFFFDFNDDFGGSRNKALKEIEKLDCDFIFMPDGHEILRPESLAVVRYYVDKYKEDPRCDFDLISCYVEIDVDEYGMPATAFPRPMMFRNKKNIFFERKVHNFVNCKQERRIISPDIRLIHNMPEDRKAMRNKQRATMNVKGLKEGADKGDIRDCFYLANTYHEMAKYDKAIKYYDKALELLVEGDVDYQMVSQVCISLSAIWAHKEEWEMIRALCLQSMKYRWDRAEAYFILGFSLTKQAKQKYKKGSKEYISKMVEACHWFRICTHMTVPVSPYFIQPKYYTWMSHDALMGTLNEVGDIEGSLKACEQVLKYKKNEPHLLENQKILKQALANKKNDQSIFETFKTGINNKVEMSSASADPFED